MAAPKEVTRDKKNLSNFIKTTHVCDISKLDNNKTDIERRNEQRHLLLSTTYGLNSSHTKKIHVGLQATNEGCFVPVVKLTGNQADGICFDADTWRQFQVHMGETMNYLSVPQNIRSNTITINNITVSLTSSYGSRAVLVAYKENPEQHANNGEAEEQQTQPPMKKRKTYAVAIVMQKTTFQGLENIVKCVDAHLSQLVSIVDTVNDCAKYTISEIELKLPALYIDCEIIKRTVKDNFHEIERNVQTQINNLTFLDEYFSIVFVELLSLRISEIVRIILLKRNS